jgi:hypothetical protein
MASIIRIKRSSGTNKPTTLNWGELAYVTGIGSYGGLNQYKDRVFLGDDGTNAEPIAGRYYTSMMEHAPGAIDGISNTRNSDGGIVAVLDNNRKVDQWNVDNLRLDGNTLSSTNTDGNIILDPTGIGSVIITDDTFLNFGNDLDSRVEYDENGTNQLTFTGADIRINIPTESNDKDTGALIVEGGVGIEKNLNVGGSVDIDSDLNVDGGDITTNLTEFNLLNATATNVNAFGAATNLVVGATTGIATILNATLSVPNATTLDLGATSSVTSVNFVSTPNTSFVSIAATTNASSTTTGALRVAGGVGIASDLYIGGLLNIAGNVFNPSNANFGEIFVSGNTILGDSPTDTVNITGIASITGSLEVDNIKINDNVISTKSGGGNVLYIDPYPDGLSNEGMVVIKGNLQVDGTTTTVDSSSVTVNGAIISLGDVTSNRTVVVAVSSGVSTISLDSVVGINTGDIVSGSASLPNSGLTTVTAYDSSTKIITIEGSTSSGITSTTQLTITHAFDTNTDRGISFDYNTSVGTANHKSGFFGFDDSAIASSSSNVDNHGTHANDSRKWTYVPDATISNSVVTGTKGFLDVKGVYYQSGDYATGGAVYFDSQGLQRSTNAVASPIITSKQILTAVTKNTFSSLSTNISVTAGDIIRQDTTDAYGIVETTVTNSNTVDLIGVEGTFTNSYNIRREGQNGFITNLSSIPGTVTVIYTNKPSWTSTLDGGSF